VKNQELTATFIDEKNVWDNGPDRRTIIGTARLPDGNTITIRGNAAEGVLIRGLQFRFYGHWRTHPKYGRQFQFSTVVQDEPVSEETVVAYLTQCRSPDRGSISRRVAEALFEKFGLDSIGALIRDPVAACEGIRQWPAEKATIAADYLKRQTGTQRAKMDLIELLDGSGVPRATVDRAIRTWGNAAANQIRENAYLLCDLPGIGFRLADKIWCEIARRECKGNPEALAARLADPVRQMWAVCDAIARQTQSTGSTWHSAAWARAQVAAVVSQAAANPARAIQDGLSEGRLRLHLQTNVSGGMVALRRAAENEDDVATWISDARKQAANWPDIDAIAAQAPDGEPLSGHQLDAIRIATGGQVGCLQGSPGVGKTFAVACIVRAIIDQHGDDSIAVAAPTGKAAVRVQQSMAAIGIGLQAGTIHRLLRVDSESGDGWKFVHNEQNPLSIRFLIVDESSMIDTDLMAALLRGCSSETQILFVGDSEQLPPVGHGRPFLDLQSCVPTGRLTTIRRNSGKIVQACAMIRDARRIEFSERLDIEAGENLVHVSTTDDQIAEAVATIIERHAGDCDDVVEQMQVLCAKNDTRRQLNATLQSMLNPSEKPIKGNPFRRGDKIVCLKNGSYPDPEDNSESIFVANGELGRVVSLRPGRMVVRLCDPVRDILVTHAIAEPQAGGGDDSRGALSDWDLGYCLSVHRSQGSQWRFVLAACESSGAMVQSRQWLYTAISRAERATYVLGLTPTIQRSLTRDGISGRTTLLRETVGVMDRSRSLDLDWIFGGLEPV